MPSTGNNGSHGTSFLFVCFCFYQQKYKHDTEIRPRRQNSCSTSVQIRQDITSDLRLGRTEALRGLGNSLSKDRPEQHNTDCLKERTAETGSGQGWEQSAFILTNMGTISRATLGRLLRHKVERVWLFNALYCQLAQKKKPKALTFFDDNCYLSGQPLQPEHCDVHSVASIPFTAQMSPISTRKNYQHYCSM